MDGPSLRQIMDFDYTDSNKPRLDRARRGHCIECGDPLHSDDIEIGYECAACRCAWMSEATWDETHDY